MIETKLAEYVKHAQSHDVKAFEYLYKSSYHYFYLEACKLLENEQDVLDILQEAYITIYSALPELRNPEKFMAWGRQIVRRKAIDFIRHKISTTGRDNLMPQNSDGHNQSIEDLSHKFNIKHEPETVVEQLFMEEKVHELLSSLPEKQRLSLLLWMDQKTYKEIAALTGVSEGTAKSRVHSAKKAIKTSFLKHNN